MENKEVNNKQTKNDNNYVMKLPESEKEQDIEVVPNKPSGWIMRVAAGLIDFCLIVLSIFGLNQIFNNTGMGHAADKLRVQMILIQDEYKLDHLVEGSDETYGHKVYEGEEEYSNYTTYVVHTDEEINYVVVNNETISKEVITAFNKAVKSDKTYSNLSFDYRLINYGISMLSCFIAQSIFLLTIPLVNKYRATPGKLLAGTMLINNKYETPARWYQIVGRFSFQYIIESALPYLFLNMWVLIVVPAVLFLITLTNKKRRTIHDFVSRCRVIDKRTFTPISEQ
jgi:uncharacterized RDD family membrane protein YckC